MFCIPFFYFSKLLKIMTEPFIISTERCLMRPIVQTDIADIFQGLSHPEVIRYYGVSYDSLQATQAQMDWYADLERKNTGRWWAVCTPSDQIFMGAVGVYNLSLNHRKAELGFWFLPLFWKQGFATESLKAMIFHFCQSYSLHRFEAQVEPGNLASLKVLQKLEFQYEGTLRDCEIKGGHFISLDIFAWLANDEKII